MSEDNVYHLRPEWKHLKVDDGDFTVKPPTAWEPIGDRVWISEGWEGFGRIYIKRSDGKLVDVTTAISGRALTMEEP